MLRKTDAIDGTKRMLDKDVFIPPHLLMPNLPFREDSPTALTPAFVRRRLLTFPLLSPKTNSPLYDNLHSCSHSYAAPSLSLPDSFLPSIISVIRLHLLLFLFSCFPFRIREKFKVPLLYTHWGSAPPATWFFAFARDAVINGLMRVDEVLAKIIQYFNVCLWILYSFYLHSR